MRMNAPSVPERLVAGLRALLEDAGFTEEEVSTLRGPRPTLAAQAAQEIYARRLTGTGRLETLVRLFALALPVKTRIAETALAPLPLDELAAAGLLESTGDSVRPLVRIAAYDGLLLASDPDLPGAERADYVTGVNPAARTLARLTLRRGVASTLDLGTGSGIQALLAARHSDAVAAVDVNPRAIAYTRLNARLNGLDNVEPLEGSWFDPVRGRRFELIVANPPYVVSPDSAYVYRDSGLLGDAVSRTLVDQLPEYLEDGGVAQVCCNWVHSAGEDWRARPETWIAGRGVDALLLHYETVEPLEYAVGWNVALEHDPAAFADALDRWLEYDARLEIERLSWGMLVLRRRAAARNRVRAIEVPGAPKAGAGRQLARMLAAWDAPLDDEALSKAVLRPVEGARLERRLWSSESGWTPERARLHLDDTIGFAVPLDDETAEVVAHCEGTVAVRDAIARAAEARRLDRDALASRALPTMRRLHELGCLVFPQDAQ
jgi:methylase of polypeptide subunit release factors